MEHPWRVLAHQLHWDWRGVVGSLGICPHFCDSSGNLPLYMAVAQKAGIPKWVALVSGNIPRPAVCPSSLVLSHSHMGGVVVSQIRFHFPQPRIVTPRHAPHATGKPEHLARGTRAALKAGLSSRVAIARSRKRSRSSSCSMVSGKSSVGPRCFVSMAVVFS